LVSRDLGRQNVDLLTTYTVASNGLLNSHQSAYSKHHTTETALLNIHDHLINAIGSQKLSVFTSFLVWNLGLVLRDFGVRVTAFKVEAFGN